jgi:N-methylhydantoinase B/acetone carboxylase alpha subunit
MRGFLEEVVAGFGGTWDFMVGGGIDHYGKLSAMGNFEISAVGGGAGTVKDGLDHAAAMWNPEGDMGNMEAWEMIEPFLYLGRGVMASSAGMGRHRGGSGFESMRFLSKTNNWVVMNMGEGHFLSFAGIFGGYPAASGYRHNAHNTNYNEFIMGEKLYPERDYSTEDSLLKKRVTGDFVFDQNCNYVAYPYKEGDFHSSFLRGAPGLGDPLERKPEAVIDDLKGGYLLERFVSTVYGVIANKRDDDWIIDRERTIKRREEIREERRAKSIPTREWMNKERERVKEKNFIQPIKDMYASSMSLSPKFATKFRSFWELDEEFTF